MELQFEFYLEWYTPYSFDAITNTGKKNQKE